jgi:hypothetical protein
VASDELEVRSLEFFLENIVSLKRNRRPLRPIGKLLPYLLQNYEAGEDDTNRRKTYLYSPKELKQAEDFYFNLIGSRKASGKVHSTQPWYYYTEFKSE